MPSTAFLVAALTLSAVAGPPLEVSFPTTDGGVVYADSYGRGEHAVVLVHGARFDKGSWESEARRLAREGFRVLAIDLRGYGESRGGPATTSPYEGFVHDVLAAVRYLRENGATEVSVVGGSLGGWAVAQAAVEAERGEIDRLVLLAHSPIDQPGRMKGRKLFVVARDDRASSGGPRLETIREQFERAREPKELLVLDGSAHAQHLFATEQGERVMAEILRFLSAP